MVVDEVSYGDGGQWPVTPDGLGPSLEVIDPDQGNDTPRNWHASTAPEGHTLGAVNSVDAAGLPPWIQSVQHTQDVQPSSPIIVSASVLDASSVELFYVKCTLATSLKRNAARTRVVPEHILREKALDISTSFDIVAPFADNVNVINND